MTVAPVSGREAPGAAVHDARRVEVDGKFFRVAGARFHVRGVTYGPFARNEAGEPFPPAPQVRRDIAQMRTLGANAIRTYTPPPRWLLDDAAAAGLRVIAGIPWAQHVCFLSDGAPAREARRRVREVAVGVGDHPAVLALLVGNETPPDVVRWEGPRRVERFLCDLADTARQSAPETLVSYANFPPTEYLDLGFFDFLSFNVYLERASDLRRYLARLQNLAGEKPLVLTELGRDSARAGEALQARSVEEQIRTTFDAGAAGAVVFSFTDEWFAIDRDDPAGGAFVRDWAFGIVDADRRPKRAFSAVGAAFGAPVPSRPARAPVVSVVVCAYDEERTIDACLRSLASLDYPSYEVIVVNDGSSDRTGAIAEAHAGPRVRVVHQENRGLSAARNRGIAEARGSVVAFTDADCVVDSAWLSYLVPTLEKGFVAVGGPNLSPPEERLVASVVAHAPGLPTHVLLDDVVAEHVPGCNMAFDRDALRAIGGFSEVYRSAGDDVDVCWRLQESGHRIGFSPAAVVWHERRSTIGAYLAQQRGYGRAEVQLAQDHPLRFNAMGQSRWLGRIYGGVASALWSPGSRIYHGALGRAPFQSIYATPASTARLLPLTFEWTVAAVALSCVGVGFGGAATLLLAPAAASVSIAVTGAVRARLEGPAGTPRGRALLALLIYLGPLVRSFARFRLGRRVEPRESRDEADTPARARGLAVPMGRRTYWSTTSTAKESFVRALRDALERRALAVRVGDGWSDSDLEACDGESATARLAVGVEDHGGAKRLLRVRSRLVVGQPSDVALGALLASVVVLGATGAGTFAFVVAVFAAGVGAVRLARWRRLGGAIGRALADAAREEGLRRVVAPGRGGAS